METQTGVASGQLYIVVNQMLVMTWIPTHSRPQVDSDSFLDDRTRISGSHPTCLCGMRPTLHGNLLEGKQRHPSQDKGPEEESGSGSGG